MNELSENIEYKKLLNRIGVSFTEAKRKAINAINSELTVSNWNTGKSIVEYEQRGNLKAEYGRQLINQLSKDLSKKYGKGFSGSGLMGISNNSFWNTNAGIFFSYEKLKTQFSHS